MVVGLGARFVTAKLLDKKTRSIILIWRTGRIVSVTGSGSRFVSAKLVLDQKTRSIVVVGEDIVLDSLSVGRRFEPNLTVTAGCVCMLVPPLWCDLGCCARTVVVIKSAAKPRLQAVGYTPTQGERGLRENQWEGRREGGIKRDRLGEMDRGGRGGGAAAR